MKNIIHDYKDFFTHISKNVLLYLGIIFFSTLLMSAYNVLYGIHLTNIGINEYVVGQVLSLQRLGIAAGAVPVALFAKRFNKKRSLLLGLLIMFMSSLLLLNVHYLPLMKVLSFVFGIGHFTVMILQGPIIYENSDEKHRIIGFSIAFVFMNLAFVFGNFILGHLSHFATMAYGSTAGNLMVLNLTTFLLPIGMLLALPMTGHSMTHAERSLSMGHDMIDVFKGYASLLKGTTFTYLLQVALVGLGAGMIVPFFSIYLKHTLSATNATVGNIMAISQVGTILGGLIVPPLAKKIGRVETIILCQLLSIPFLISISFPQGIYILTVSFFFRSTLMNMSSPLFRSIAMEITTEEKRTHMSGMISLMNNLFRSIGILFGGYLMHEYSYNTPYYFTIAFYLLGTFIIYRFFYHKDLHQEKGR